MTINSLRGANVNTQNKSDNFYGGILQKILDRHGFYYHLDHQIISKIIEDDPELNTGAGSAVEGSNFLPDFLDELNPIPIDIIEIGTFMGMGSAVLASYARTVFTFDIWYRNSHPLWVALELDDRINCYTGDQKFIDEVIRAIKYNPELKINFAFIDGEHKYKNIKHDFEQVSFCGRVLFHDADILEIGKFITEEIGGRVLSEETTPSIGTFGYWVNEEIYDYNRTNR